MVGGGVNSLQFHFSNSDIQFCTTEMFCGFDAEIENVAATTHTHTHTQQQLKCGNCFEELLKYQKIPFGCNNCKQIVAASALITQKRAARHQATKVHRVCVPVCVCMKHMKSEMLPG